MAVSLILAMLLGVAGGYFFLDIGDKDTLDTVLMRALYFMILVCGIEIGSNKDLVRKIFIPQNLFFALAVPVTIIIGSFA